MKTLKKKDRYSWDEEIEKEEYKVQSHNKHPMKQSSDHLIGVTQWGEKQSQLLFENLIELGRGATIISEHERSLKGERHIWEIRVHERQKVPMQNL